MAGNRPCNVAISELKVLSRRKESVNCYVDMMGLSRDQVAMSSSEGEYIAALFVRRGIL